jgi:hypothetical protein
VIIGRYKVNLSRRRVIISKLNILLQAAMDIMENQSGTLADRPRMIAAGELFNGRLSIAYTPFRDRFGRMRRLAIRNISTLLFNFLQSPSHAFPA